MNGQAPQELEQKKGGEGEADEEEAILRGALELLVEADRFDQGHGDLFPHPVAREGAARRLAGALSSEARDFPARGEALRANSVLCRQKAPLERGVRPVGAHRDDRIGAKGDDGEGFRSAEREGE